MIWCRPFGAGFGGQVGALVTMGAHDPSRDQDEGLSGPADRSHKVRHYPWQIPAELEAAVCELRRAHPKWGSKRLVFVMDRCGQGLVLGADELPAVCQALWSTDPQSHSGLR